MNSTPIRLVLITVVVVATFVWLERVRKQSIPEKVFLPRVDLREMPLEFGSWKGTSTELDPEVFRALDAAVVVDRAYQNPTGRVITLHCAAFTDEVMGLPHNPTICYTGTGHQILRDDAVKLYLDADSNVTVHSLTMQRSGAQVQAMYWYQVGDCVVQDSNAVRYAYWKWCNKEARPALIKVLLQTTARDPIEGEEQLRTFAALVYRWLQSVQGQGQAPPAARSEGAGAESPEKPHLDSSKAPSAQAVRPPATKPDPKSP